MRLLAQVLVTVTLAAASVTALAQPVAGRERQGWQRHDGSGRMSGEERQRLREDVQRQHANPQRGARDSGGEERARRYAEWQRLSPEQREGVRRQMRDANRDFDRHK
ncbi:MAG: hypothetical protein EXR29_15240 [Betaproteobacteria bacterium]|nr:hypothetical protein [Betaproteobacteria bacterium]